MTLLFLCSSIWFAPVFAVLQYSWPLFQVRALGELLRVPERELTLQKPAWTSKLPKTPYLGHAGGNLEI